MCRNVTMKGRTKTVRFSETYLKPCQTSKMERFAKIVNVKYSRKTLHLRCLAGF